MLNKKHIKQDGRKMTCKGVIEMAITSSDATRGAELRLPIRHADPRPEVVKVLFKCREDKKVEFICSGGVKINSVQGYTQVTFEATSKDGKPYDPKKYTIDFKYKIDGEAIYPEM